MRLCKNKAFTLTEIIIVLAIIAIVVGLAVPGYFRTVEQSRSNEARTNLNIIHMGEKIYRINNGVFVAGAAINALNTSLNTDMSATFYDTVSVTINGGTSYTARLTRNTTSGGAGTKWFQYDFTNGNAAPVLTEGGAY